MTEELDGQGICPHPFQQNGFQASLLREHFRDAGIFAVTLSSSSGAGKTALMEAALSLLREDFRVAALVDEHATAQDLQRLAQSRVPVRQLHGGRYFELDAARVHQALEGWETGNLDFLFVEIAGDWADCVCSDLGENLRVALLSLTEGDDRPMASPMLLQSADVVIVTKIDLSDLVEFDWPSAHTNIQAIRPGMDVFKISAKTGEGMKEFTEYLEARLLEFRSAQST
jgi:hydrogenase nickel incorporation protein HypB